VNVRNLVVRKTSGIEAERSRTQPTLRLYRPRRTLRRAERPSRER
jgi:hypothetical protein